METVDGEIILSRSALAHIHDSVETGTSPSIGFAKRGLSVLSANATLAFNLNRGLHSFTRSAAARSEAEEKISKRPKILLKDFNGTTVLGATAAAVPAIAVSGERAPPNDAEKAASFLAELEQNTEKMRALHESNSDAGEGRPYAHAAERPCSPAAKRPSRRASARN